MDLINLINIREGLMVYSPVNAIINGNSNIKSKINIVLGELSRGHQPLFGEEYLMRWGRDI